MSVKDRIKTFIDNQKITTKTFEETINASNGYVNSISKSIGLDKMEALIEKFPNLNIEWLLTGKGEMLKNDRKLVEEPVGVYQLRTDRNVKEQQIPLYNIEASAGVVELFINKSSNKPIDYISIPNLPKCDGAIYVTGDSMYPLLKSGDIVMYKELNNSLDNVFFGEMYLLSIDLDGEEYVTVKWVNKSEKEDHIKIVSENRHHQPKDIHFSKIKAMALIKASIRINSMS